MRIYPTNRFEPGTYKRECDICGWDYLRSEMRKQWDGLIVCQPCYTEKDTQLEKKYRRINKFQKD